MLKHLGIPVTLWVHERTEQFKVKGKLRTGRRGSSRGRGSSECGREEPKAAMREPAMRPVSSPAEQEGRRRVLQ